MRVRRLGHSGSSRQCRAFRVRAQVSRRPMHRSRAAGYRKSLEGWAKAGIKYVELTDTMLDEFLKTDSLAAAKSVVTDLGLTPVSSAAVLPDVWIPGPARAASLETWKKRCEQFA